MNEIKILSKKEFLKRLNEFNKSLLELSKKYIDLSIKNPNDRWIQEQIKQLAYDIQHNNEMIRRVEIEDGYLIYYVDETLNLAMTRCSKEEYEEIYKKSKDKFYID